MQPASDEYMTDPEDPAPSVKCIFSSFISGFLESL